MSDSIKTFWEENGYYHARGVFSPAELKPLEEDFDRIVAQLQSGEEEVNARWRGSAMEKLDGGQSVIIHTHNVQCYSATWAKALYHEQFLSFARAILGEDVILHHTKLFQKPPEKGSPFPVHQDWTYFPTRLDTMMAGIIHLSNATDEMGCLRVYPGSHRLGRVPQTSGQLDSELLQEYPLEKATVVECEPGDVVFFHYFTLHGSMPNRSPHTRKTVLAQMHAGNDEVEEGNHHPNARLVLHGWNHCASRSHANEIG
jgi:ectoine hydroxylase-related dioxygenase (phytanoyl-CoA dioxygenase family)